MHTIARTFLALACLPLGAVAAPPAHATRFDLAAAITQALTDAIFATGFETVTLTIDNRLTWCSVSQNGGAASTLALTQTDYPQGVVVALQAGPSGSSFVWGYWNGTDAGGTDTNPNASVTMNADKTVLACCPFASAPDTPCP